MAQQKVSMKTKCIILQIDIETYKDIENPNAKRINWIKIRGYKDGVVKKSRRFIETEGIVKRTNENMKYIGESVFNACREMALED
jgi:hypothetical protein